MTTDVKISIALEGAQQISGDAQRVNAALQGVAQNARRMSDAMASSAGSEIASQARQMAEAFSQVGRSSEAVKQAGEALASLASQSSKASRGMDNWRGLVADFAHVGQSILIVKEAISGFVNVAGATFTALTASQQAAQKLAASLEFSSGSSRGAAAEMAYLAETSRRLGLDFGTASTAYAKFAAASREAGVSSEIVKTVFEGVSKASARLGLSAEETQGALLALSQMASKGTVSAEELRGQLGERLPGAFSIAAKAMGVTEQELGKLLETGKVVANDFLPKFGAALNDKFTAPLTSLTAEMNRFNSAWEIWKREFSNADGGGFKWLTDGLNESAKAMASLGKAAGVVQRVLAAISGFQMGAFGMWGGARFDTVQAQQEAMQKYAQVSAGIRAMESRNLNYMEQEQLRDLKRQKDDLLADLDSLARRRGRETFKPIDLAGDAAKQMEANRAAIKQIYDDAAKFAAEHGDQFAKKRIAVEDFEKRFLGLKESNPAYYAQLRKQLDDSMAGGSKNDLQQSLAARMSLLQDASRREVEIIKDRVKASELTEFEGIEAVRAAQVAAFEEQYAIQQKMLAGANDKGDRDKVIADMQKTVVEWSAIERRAALDVASAANKASDEFFAAINKENAALDASIDKAREELAAIGQTADAKDLLRAKSLELAAQQADETAAVYETAQAWSALNDDAAAASFYERAKASSEERARKLRDLASIETQQAAKREAVRAAEDSKRAWEDFARDIERSLTDSLMRGFEAGKGFGDNFVDSLKNTLKTAALKVMVQAIVSPVMNTAGQLLGFAPAGSPGGGAASVASAMGLANNALSLYSGATSLLSYGQAAYAGYGLSASEAAAAANAYYSAGYYGTGAAIQAGSAVGSAAAGSGAAAGSAAGGAAGGSAAAGSAAAAEGGSAAAGSASAAGASSGLATAGAYAAYAYIGYQIGNYLGKQMFGGKVSMNGTGLMGTLTYNGFESLANYADMHRSGGWFKSGKDWTNSSALDDAQLEYYRNLIAHVDDPFRTLNNAAGGNEGMLYDRGAGWRYSFKKAVSSEADVKALFDEVSESLGHVLLPELEKFRLEGEKLYQTAARMQDAVVVTNNLADVLGKDMKSAFGALGVESLDARQAVVAAAGGLEALKGGVASYYESFLDESERLGRLGSQISQAFAGLSIAMPTSKDAFRSLVESLDLTAVSGQHALGVMLQVAPVFSQWADAVGQNAEVLKNFYTDQERFDQSLAELSATFTGLGLSMPKTKAEFRTLVDSLDITTYAGLKTHTALVATAQAFSDFVDAVDSKVSALESQRLSIAQNVVGARDGFIKSILTALGRTAAVRSMDLAGVDPLNLGLARLSYALQDAQTAAQDLTGAQAALAQAQSDYTSRLVSAGGGIAEFVRSIREGMGATADSLDRVQASYQADLASARSGDIAAAERIPASARAYLDAVRQTAGSSTEVDIAMTRMAGELEDLPAVKSWAEVQAKTLADIAESLDKNHAEVLAKTDTFNKALISVLQDGFSIFDSSTDGLLTFDELKAGLSGLASDAQIQALIRSVDENGDGQLSKMEAVRQATNAVDDNTGALIDGSDSQITEMRRMVAETMVNSGRMMELNASIVALKNEISVQNAEKKREADLAAANLALESLAKQKEGTVAAVNAGIQSIWDLASRYGVQLLNGNGGGAYFGVNDTGLFNSSYDAISYTVGRENDVTNFQNAFYAAGGAYDQTYGMADDLLAIKAKLDSARQAVIDLGGVPKFAAGGLHMGGLRLVGEKGPELEATGPSRIYTFEQTRALLGGGEQGLAGLLSEVRALREEVAALRSDNSAENRAIATHAYKSAKRLDDMVGDGLIVRTDKREPLEVMSV